MSVERIGRKQVLAGGISIGSEEVTAGTLTGRFIDLTDGKIVMVSNRHVLEGIPGKTIVLQPGPYDGGKKPEDKIGTVKRLCNWSDEFPLWKKLLCRIFGHWLETYCESNIPNCIDAGVIEYEPYDISRTLKNGAYIDGDKILSITNTASGDNINGKKVWKSGRTTGLTIGTVIDDSATIKVWYGDMFRAFRDVVLVQGVAKGGDSGSPVFLMTGDNPSENDIFCGILFGGSNANFIFCKYKYLVEVMKVRWH